MLFLFMAARWRGARGELKAGPEIGLWGFPPIRSNLCSCPSAAVIQNAVMATSATSRPARPRQRRQPDAPGKLAVAPCPEQEMPVATDAARPSVLKRAAPSIAAAPAAAPAEAEGEGALTKKACIFLCGSSCQISPDPVDPQRKCIRWAYDRVEQDCTLLAAKPHFGNHKPYT